MFLFFEVTLIFCCFSGQADVTAEDPRPRRSEPAFLLHRPSSVTRRPSSTFSAIKTSQRWTQLYHHHRHCHMTGLRNRWWREPFLCTATCRFHGKGRTRCHQLRWFPPSTQASKWKSTARFTGATLTRSRSLNYPPRRNFSRSFPRNVGQPRRRQHSVCTRMRRHRCNTISHAISYGGKVRYCDWELQL